MISDLRLDIFWRAAVGEVWSWFGCIRIVYVEIVEREREEERKEGVAERRLYI